MEAGQGPGGGEVGDPSEREVPKPYVPTEEERRLLKECAEESARYRAFPLAAASMLATSFLIRRGVLRDSSRFGSFTKVAFAGMCGYLAGKISYLPICSEKFKKLKDSPIGDVLRQAQRHSSHNRSSRKSEFSDTPSQSFTESSPRAGFPLPSSYSDDYSSTDRALSSYEPVPFSASLNESSPTGITDYTVQADFLRENCNGFQALFRAAVPLPPVRILTSAIAGETHHPEFRSCSNSRRKS
ncbi:OCIA domain-containing protein 1 isoform 3-T4 [Alca torda]